MPVVRRDSLWLELSEGRRRNRGYGAVVEQSLLFSFCAGGASGIAGIIAQASSDPLLILQKSEIHDFFHLLDTCKGPDVR
jgi:hypothetical protein